jgi:hypothetical protein
MEAVHLSIYDLNGAEAAREDVLSEAERAEAASLCLGQRRRDEWIRGRTCVRRALVSRFGEDASSTSLLADADGAPRLSGSVDCAVSLSHDGDYFAVAIAERALMRVGVDICLRQHEARLRRILQRLKVCAPGIDVVAQWAAAECFLKLRRLGVAALLDTALTLEQRGETMDVYTEGAKLSLSVSCFPEFVVAWGGEPTA